ncbi:MAG TPA: hypothetical protein VFE46_08335 [Pirellulales bacterium]|jgi:hypothetical protein|nr:hypothetical protein [Pirellulales bacterium]
MDFSYHPVTTKKITGKAAFLLLQTPKAPAFIAVWQQALGPGGYGEEKYPNTGAVCP